MQLCFTVQGFPLKSDLLVTEEVEELMLGIDWLSAQSFRPLGQINRPPGSA